MDKSQLSEADIISKFILPAVDKAGWDFMSQMRQEVKLRDGKVIVRGQVGMRKTVKSAFLASTGQLGTLLGRMPLSVWMLR
jgi:type I restriction enzyme R subunit